MSVITFQPAVRQATAVYIGLGGPSGSGKTFSSLRLATGLAGGKPIAFIDTESGRALHYADQFQFQHGLLRAPFNPLRYRDALMAATSINPGCIIVDSTSHIHEGPGGRLDMHEAELSRRAGDDWQKRDRLTFGCWAKPTAEYTQFVNAVLQLNIHTIFCFRAKDKLKLEEVVRDGKKRMEPVPQGWQPIMTAGFEFEMTVLLMLPPGAKGIPDLRAEAAKMTGPLESIFPPGQQIDEQMGERLAAWCAGSLPAADSNKAKAADPDETRRLLIETGDAAAAEGKDTLQRWWSSLSQASKRLVGEVERDRMAAAAKAAEAPAAPSLDLHDEPPADEQNISAWTEWVDLALDQLRGCRSLGAIQVWEEDNRPYLDDLAQQDPAGRNRITATIKQVKMQLRGTNT